MELPKYGYNWGDSAACSHLLENIEHELRKLERTIKFNFIFLNLLVASNHSLLPDNNPKTLRKLFVVIYVQVLEPYDTCRNTQLLIPPPPPPPPPRAQDDPQADKFLGWIWDFQRRVRAWPLAQVTDGFLGSDLMDRRF